MSLVDLYLHLDTLNVGASKLKQNIHNPSTVVDVVPAKSTFNDFEPFVYMFVTCVALH